MISRDDILREARLWIGTPYRHQASLCQVGCDCLGLVRGIWRVCFGQEPESPPPYTPNWAHSCKEERLLDAAMRHLHPLPFSAFQAGDLLFFRWHVRRPAEHIAIATSSTHMIHAQEGACVCEVPLTPSWQRRLTAAYMFKDLLPHENDG